MDRGRGMRSRRGRSALAAGPTMTARRTAAEIVDGIDLSGKTCVITGASSGLGRESARALAAAGAHVILAARNQQALAESAGWVQAEVPTARTSTVPLDLTAL